MPTPISLLVWWHHVKVQYYVCVRLRHADEQPPRAAMDDHDVHTGAPVGLVARDDCLPTLLHLQLDCPPAGRKSSAYILYLRRYDFFFFFVVN